MKKHNLLKVVLLTIFVVWLGTWLLPTASFQYELAEEARNQMGIFDLSSYPMVILSYFSYVLLYVLAIGGFYGVLYKIPAYRKLLEKFVKVFKGREWIFLTAVMILTAVIVSVTGLSIGILFLFPFLIAVILLMGYNKLVAASVTVGSVMTGLIGTTLGVSSIDYINKALGTDVFTEITTKIMILIVVLILLVFNVLRYAKKVKNNNDEVKEELVPEKKNVSGNKKTKIWPLVVVLDVVILLTIIGTVPWKTLDIDIFSKALEAIQSFKIFGFAIFDKILGGVFAFGEWSIYSELPGMLFIATIILALIYRVKFDDFIDGFVAGLKKAIGPAAIMTLIYLVLIITTNHGFQLVIVNAILDITKGLNVVTMSLITFITSILNVESTYVAQRVLPFVASVITDTKLYPLLAIIFQSIYGLTMLVAPTSLILIGTLSYMNISYGQWLKHIWKLLLEIFIVLLIIFVILLLI